MNQLTVKPEEYIVQELEYLRKVYDETVKETRTLERYLLVAIGAIWSWCAIHLGAPGVKALVWLPSIMTVLFGLRAFGLHRHILAIVDYLAKVEMAFQLPEDFGWEQRQKRHPYPLQALTAYAFWLGLQAVTVVIAIIYG